MEIRILHFYPDLMSLYGSYANVSILKRTLEELGKKGEIPSLLLHGCCAPCSSYVLEYLSRYFTISIYSPYYLSVSPAFLQLRDTSHSSENLLK